MTAEQPEIPPPLPDGYAPWLDGLVAALDEMRFAMAHYFYRNGARAELAELRQALADRSADLAICRDELESVAKDRDEAMKKLSDTEGWLATARQQALDLDAQRAEAVRERDEARDHLKTSWSDCVATARERDEARAKLAELRAEALALGEITPHDAMWFADSLRYACWNALVAKLRADAAAKEGT